MGRRGAALKLVALTAALAAGPAACAERTMYDWGSYEESVYGLWCEPGSWMPTQAIGTLTDEVTETKLAGRKPPPGVQAHLGYLQLLVGDGAAAVSWFREEKAAYSESAVFMDRLIAKVGR